MQILMRERYEQSHGIYDHRAATDDHFALVRHHWCEDAIVASRLRERLEAFADLKIGTAFHMSFTEFINQPPYMCDLMLEIMEKRAPEQAQELHDLLQDMKKEQGKK